MRRRTIHALALATLMAGSVLGSSLALAEGGVLTIGRREDGTTFDPIKTAQNVDFWVFMNVHDVLVRVDKSGKELVPGLAESWEMSPDGLTYTFRMRDAKFSDGSPITAEDAAFSILRIRDSEESLWSDSYQVVKTAEAKDDRTLVVTLNTPSAPFLASLAMPGVSVLSKAAIEADEIGFGEMPVASGAFKVKEWIRGDKVVLERNPEFWEADKVKLDGVEWVSVPDDNTRMLKVQAGELDAAIFVPFSSVAELEKNPDLTVHKDPSTREDHLLLNHEHPALAKKEVRQALDFAIDKQSIVDTVTFGVGEVANSYVPRGALYHNDDNLQRPYDPEKARQLLAEAGESNLTLNYLVEAGAQTWEQTAVLIQEQLAKAGVTVNLQKVDPSTAWDIEVAGEYDLAENYWTNDVIDPDQKTTFVLGHDTNMNYMTRYNNPKVKELVDQARVEMDPARREALYKEIQVISKDDVHWIDLYYSPFVNVSRKNIENFYQNPLGRFFLEDTVKN